MYTIKHQDGTYFHNKGRIILFETPEEANGFLGMFIEYSTQRLAQEGKIKEIIHAQMFPNECSISKVNFDINKVECGTVLARELFENR